MEKGVDIVPALIMIPDMNHFTEFMTGTDIECSRIVIPELLKTIIHANRIDLSVAEIQGDAILFYKIGPLPAFRDVLLQGLAIFEQFASRFSSLIEENQICFKGHRASKDLMGLKIIINYGEIGLAKVDGQTKLIGEPLIIAHKLLKNSILDEQYLLMTDALIDQYCPPGSKKDELCREFLLHKGRDRYEFLGKIRYHYLRLETLRRLLSEGER